MKFLDNLGYSSITSIHVNEMDQPQKPSEIANSIKLMQSGKTPSPSGYLVDFFETFIDKLPFPFKNVK